MFGDEIAFDGDENKDGKISPTRTDASKFAVFEFSPLHLIVRVDEDLSPVNNDELTNDDKQ